MELNEARIETIHAAARRKQPRAVNHSQGLTDERLYHADHGELLGHQDVGAAAQGR